MLSNSPVRANSKARSRALTLGFMIRTRGLVFPLTTLKTVNSSVATAWIMATQRPHNGLSVTAIERPHQNNQQDTNSNQ